MQKHKTTRMAQSRDVGLPNGAGKGDAPRSCFSSEFHNNFSEIKFTGVSGFERQGRKLVKHYRPALDSAERVC